LTSPLHPELSEMLFEEIEDGIVSDARAGEPRFTFDEVEAELRTLGKIK
jgi:hypothetical protein